MHNDALLLLAALLCLLLLLHTSNCSSSSTAHISFDLDSSNAPLTFSDLSNFHFSHKTREMLVMLQMIRSSHLGTCCCKQTVHSTHTRTTSNLHGCCGHTALLLLKCALLSLFFSSFSFSLFLFSEKRNDLRHGVRWLSVIVHRVVARSAGQLLRVSAGIQR